MSTISTSLAASVAQTAHNAQQAARQRDKTRNDRATDQADFNRLMTEKLNGPEDAEDPSAELPDRQAPGYEQLYPLPEHADLPPQPNQQGNSDHANPIADFHHIDIKA